MRQAKGMSRKAKERLRVSIDIRPLQMSSRYQGIGVYAHNLVQSLMRIDQENEYLLFQMGRAPSLGLKCQGNFKPFVVRRFYAQDQRLAPLMDQVLTPWDLLRARGDVHHALSIHYACGWIPCARVVTIQDLIPLVFPDEYTRTGLKHRMLYRFAARANHILTPTEHARKDVHRLLGIPLDRITVTPYAADERFRPIEDAAEVEKVVRRYGVRSPYILYVGGFTKVDPRKKVKDLVEVHRELRHKGFERIQLVLAGKRGPYSRALEQEVGGLDPRSGVLFTDYVEDEDLPYLYGGARCFVFPSVYEGFGLPVVEAMSCGTPTIAYRSSCLPEVLGDGGMLVDPQEPAQLFEALRRVLEDDALAGELRARGIRRAGRFRWEETGRKTLEVYRAVCMGGAGA